MRGRNRAGAKVVRRLGAAEGQFHVRVRIDPAWDHEFSRSVDHVVRFHVETAADHGDRSFSIRMSAW